MSEPTLLSIVFTPAVSLDRRYKYEDRLERLLAESQVQIDGGGTALDGSSCDIGVSTSDPEVDLQLIRKALASMRVPMSTNIQWSEGEKAQIQEIYGNDLRFRPWWQFW